MQEPRTYLHALGLTESEITVYLAMLGGARTARDLVKTTRLKRPTVYYALGCLEKRGLAGKTGLSGDKGFFLEPVEKLSVLAHQRSLEATKLEANIEALVGTLEATAPAQEKPIVAFYEGVEASKNAIMEMLYTKSKRIDSVVPQDNFFWQVGKDFVESFVEERMRRRIRTKNLWEASISESQIKKYYSELSEVRLLPTVMHGRFHTSMFLYDDKTLLVSSKQKSYCVLITSKEYTDTMRAMFDGLWSASLPHTDASH